MRNANENGGIRDTTGHDAPDEPHARRTYSAAVQAMVRDLYGDVDAALDAGDLVAARALLETLPLDAERTEYGPRHAQLPDWMREMAPYELFVSDAFLRAAAERGMTPMQWASMHAMQVQGVDRLDLGAFEPEGETGLVIESLTIFSGDLRYLPPGLRVRGLLQINGARIEEFPEDLRVGGCIIDHCLEFRALPPRFATANNVLDIRNCPKFTTLPETLAVGGSFQLYKCPGVKHLPGGRIEGESAVIHCEGLEGVSPDLAVGGEAKFWHCPALTGLSAMPTKKLLEIINCPAFRSLPDDAELDALELAMCAIEHLPRGLRVNRLVLDLENLRDLPDDLQVTVSLDCPGRLWEHMERLQKAGLVTKNSEYDREIMETR